VDWEANNEVLGELALRLGTHTDDEDADGNSALHLAAMAANVSALKMLLSEGVKSDIENSYGEDA